MSASMTEAWNPVRTAEPSNLSAVPAFQRLCGGWMPPFEKGPGGSPPGPFSFRRGRRVSSMRYLVTGGSGYIGSRLVERLGERAETDRIVIADIRPPRSFRPKSEWAELDVRDAAATRDLIARER